MASFAPARRLPCNTAVPDWDTDAGFGCAVREGAGGVPRAHFRRGRWPQRSIKPNERLTLADVIERPSVGATSSRHHRRPPHRDKGGGGDVTDIVGPTDTPGRRRHEAKPHASRKREDQRPPFCLCW